MIGDFDWWLNQPANQQSQIETQQLIINQRSPESTMLFNRSSPAGETAGSRCR
jgi:hypothetical protein